MTAADCAALRALLRNNHGKEQGAEGYALYAIIHVKGEKTRCLCW